MEDPKKRKIIRIWRWRWWSHQIRSNCESIVTQGRYSYLKNCFMPKKCVFGHFLQKIPVPNFFVNWFRKGSPRPFQRCMKLRWCIFFHLVSLLPHCALQINTSLLLLCFFLFPEWSQFCVSKLIWKKILSMQWFPIFCVVHKKRDVQSGLISAPLDFDACPKIWHKRGWKLSGNWNTAMWLALSTQFLLHFDEHGLAAIWICKQIFGFVNKNIHFKFIWMIWNHNL